MPDRSFLSWPFFEDRHRAHAERLEAWCAANLPADHGDIDAACRKLVGALGDAGWLKAERRRSCRSGAARRAHALHHARDAGAP